MGPDNLKYFVNHLFLPPKLPQEDDKTINNQNSLLDHVVESVIAFCREMENNEINKDVRQCWLTLCKMLRSMQTLRETGVIPLDALRHAVEDMRISDILCLHISQQNAGIILRKPNNARITLEFFQASPTAKVVAGNRGKLLMQFPSRPRLSISISPQSIQSLCAYLVAMDCTPMPDATASSKKAGNKQTESREVSDIRYISEILGGIARVLTDDLDSVASSTVYVGKRINDHVLWDSALNPWRRDPQWLVIRVALQTSLKGWNMDERYGYKAFITYVLARALQKAILAGLDHDLLFVMNAKIATRVSKLTSSEFLGFPNNYIRINSVRCRKLLEDAWQDLQKVDAQRLPWIIPTREEIQEAEGFALMRGRNYLSAVYNRSSALGKESSVFSLATFEASLVEDILRKRTSPPADIPTVSVGTSVWLAILDIEDWIIHELHDWQENTDPQRQLSTLGEMITRHNVLTSSLKNPELFSKVFLVILELWVAFDTAACRVIPLLKDYTPELYIESFKPLILPTLRQMQRLEQVEAYLIFRHNNSHYKEHSAFKFIYNKDSFAARYFANNDSLQSLCSRIQMDATMLREEKIQEYKRLDKEYNRLLVESEGLDCEHVEVRKKRNRLITVHSSHCEKCAILRKARNMSIAIFEWPLPEDELLSHLVVFELHLPQSFGLWRDITYDLGRSHSSTASSTTPRPAVVLESYTPLRNYFAPNCPHQHISIASNTKSFHMAHYKKRSFPCQQDDVVKNHPLHYKLHDVYREDWIPTGFPLIDISKRCTMEVPSGPYQKLFWTLTSTNHTPNMVIARQSECPIEITYHEWEAFGHLRSGNRLQWRNIVLELVRNTLTFRDPSVHLLFRQAAWQAEQRSDVVYREAHCDLAQESFGMEVVTALDERLKCIRDNWQESWTAATLSIIACRLFSLNHFSEVRRELLIFLASLRETLFQWMDLVLRQTRSQADLTAESAVELRNRIILIAATCRSTYVFENDENFTSVFTDPHNVATFIKCAMVLQSNVPENLHTLSSPLRYIVERDIVLSVEVVEYVITLTLEHNEGLEDAICYVWDGFRRDPLLPWRRVSDRSSWITCETVIQNGDDQACYVHLDLLDGKFLVNGKTLVTLPKDILQHNLFQKVFPNHSTMDIIPSKMRGMVYQLSRNVDSRDRKLEIHFSKIDNELLILTRDFHSQDVSEFVETEKLKEDIPNVLLVGTVHMYHYSSKCLQIYPAPSGWDPSALPIWTMQFTDDPLVKSISRPTLMEKSLHCINRSALCPHSPVVRGLFAIFQSLEISIGNLLVTWTPSTAPKSVSSQYPNGGLQVHLPRYKLTFVMGDQGDLECKELPGLVISPKQSIGTFFGLKNKLILDPKDGSTMRKVILPDGDIEVSRNSHHLSTSHPEIWIVPCQDPGVQIRIFIYDVDELIGRLMGDGTLTSWYFQTYLQILTSSYLPDPLTQRTGVEQALIMLESSNSFAFMELTLEQMKYLQLIVAVTPVRKYYPTHLTSMERVHWHPVLSPLSQSDCFVPLVQAILDHGSNQALFYGNTAKAAFKSYEGSLLLRERAEIRNSRSAFNNFYRKKQPCDYIYSPACCLEIADGDSVERENRVAQTAALVYQWTTSLDTSPDLWKEFNSWKMFSTRIDDDITFDCPKAWLLMPLSQTWFSLYSCCMSASRDKNMYGLMFALGILSHRSDIDLQLVHGALAIATKVAPTPCLRPDDELLPVDQVIDLTPGYKLHAQEICAIAKQCCTPLEFIPQARMVFDSEESRAYDDQYAVYHAEREEQCQSLTQYLFSQWPTSAAQVPDTGTDASDYSLINESFFKRSIEKLFSSRFLNHRLFLHTVQLQRAFAAIYNPQEDHTILSFCPDPPVIDFLKLLPRYVHVSLSDLVTGSKRPAPVPGSPDNDQGWILSESESETKCHSIASSTRGLISRLSTVNDVGFLSRYTRDLRQCVRALETRTSRNERHSCNSHAPRLTVENIQHALQPQSNWEKMLDISGLWPSLGPESLLGQLSLHARKGLHPDWQSALVRYAEGMALDQREKRIAVLQHLGLEAERIKEAANHGGEGWEAVDRLDWLLIQIDANLLIRPVQASIAHEMMSPKSHRNTVMQLNMGEGKSSVIVPIISTALADGDQLVRVIVLKPLCAQMFHLLKQRICGLANRRLYYLPFSRNVSLDAEKVRVICDMFKACARYGGVLLCQPEHILSFQLMGLHLLCNTEEMEQAAPFLRAQEWLDLNARDILDESDEILSVRYQLIYTLGTPGPLEGQPDRWQTIQNVFTLIKDSLNKITSEYRDGLEVEYVEPISQRFPRTRILTRQCGSVLLELIAHQIIFLEKLPLTPFRGYPNEIRECAFQFVTNIDITQRDSDTLEDYSPEYFGQLLLLRGLIAHGILLLSLKEKRWRVDYGLDPSRSMLAVPYRAKDCPSTRAEFGHPDMIIVLTCLSYYYGGLSDKQLEWTFQRLFETDNPELRYEDWTKGYATSLPESLLHLQGLNLDDKDQKYHHIFPRLRSNKAVIDFYLSECVFPREAKAFKYKLTTNPWDLARDKTRLTTGFSGTNDNSYLLPLSISQLDSSDQQHTNAQVLEYILLPENRFVVHTKSNTGLGLIEQVVTQDSHIMVLLDVGAQVLELQNEDVAREWLKRDTHTSVEAAIYCDSSNDEFYVLTRDGHVEPLESSLYRTQLNKALVYLDEARTRGTDFKFPMGTRAVATLGPKLNKDKLVQGCMRMRKLGSGHSVLFFASSEIWRKIQESIGVKKDVLDSSDVLIWAMLETCAQIKSSGAHWASQGLNFDDRRTAWQTYKLKLSPLSKLGKALREKESRTLKQLYGIRENDALLELSSEKDCRSKLRQEIQAKCEEFGIRLSRSTALLEEQERELAHEKDDEREVERVLAAQPLQHFIDPGLLAFIQSGTRASLFRSLADCLEETSYYSNLLTISKTFFQSPSLRATSDFASTIQTSPGHGPNFMNGFLRSVQWILRPNSEPNVLVLISPFEANAMLPHIRKSNSVRLHLYSPRVSRQSRSFEDLDFLVVPRPRSPMPPLQQSIQELNLFSGQLFFRDWNSCKAVCQKLGLHLEEIPEDLKGKVNAGGFVEDLNARRVLGIQGCAFRDSPVAFMRELIGWRRKGQSFTLTHLGQVLHGIGLRDSEFQDELPDFDMLDV